MFPKLPGTSFVLIIALSIFFPAPSVLATAGLLQVGPDGGYVGSQACEGCHTAIYRNWQSTRHSYSILSAMEAKKAGYPLPRARRGGVPPTIRSWDEISYIVGGRQRITYVDTKGRVLDTSYHHRIGKWDWFPSKNFADCGPCHLTGFGAGKPHPDDPLVPGRWAEINIGCEACHGPGARHVQTYEKDAIRVDVSSRLCGTCHTAAGRVLPMDDAHATHDLVQVWNHDRHVTGVKFHSHNGFCSSCHSPYRGYFVEPLEGAKKRVFTEDKQNITCIACHDPHALTNAHYSRDEVSLEPPRRPQLNIYRGNDADFLTSDFENFQITQQTCVQCHRGADRIDLDHANATCNDCHNTFNRNRSLETRVFHDANHPALSCRPCHRDADHLLSILYRDPDFLQPKNIHNLRKLPAAVRAKYGLRYPGRARLGTPGNQEPTGEMTVGSNIYSRDQPRAAAPPVASARTTQGEGLSQAYSSRLQDNLHTLLSSELHRRLAEDDRIRALQAGLAEEVRAIPRYLDLALAYGHRNECEAARQVLQHAMRAESTRAILELLFESAVPVSAVPNLESQSSVYQSLVERCLPLGLASDSEAVRLWLQGYMNMVEGDFADAARAFAAARTQEQKTRSLDFYISLAEIGQHRYQEAIAALEPLLGVEPERTASRVALGLAYMQLKRFVRGRLELEKAIGLDPEDPVVHYLLGQTYLRQGNPGRAREALQATVSADPDFLDAWFLLARAHRLTGFIRSAINAYREIIRQSPGQYAAHFRLANLYKRLSDNMAFQFYSDRETAPDPETSVLLWRDYLATLQQRRTEYGQLALSEFAIALKIQPLDLEAIRQVCEIYRHSDRQSEAQECFEWLKRHLPDQWIFSYRLGTILLQLGQLEDAIQLFQEALVLAPTQGDVYLALGLAHARAGRWEEALHILEQGTIYEPFNPSLYTNLGATYAKRGEYELARKALRRAVELATFPLPRLHLTYTNLALVYLREGLYEEATQALRTALHFFPDYQYAQDLLGTITSLSGQERRDAVNRSSFVFNELLEIFGEVTTVAFDNE